MSKLLILLLSVICFTARAQKIYFSDTTNEWTSLCVNDPTPPIEYLYTTGHSFSGDTILNNRTYSILSGNYVRDDTPSQKVLVYVNDSTERTLYDYSLKVGDTFTTATNYMKYYCIVTSVDSFMINSISYKMQQFDVLDTLGYNHLPFQVLEGVGCPIVNSFYPFHPTAVEIGCWLCSFTNDGIAPSTTPQNIIPNDCTLSAKSVGSTKRTISVFPNPVTDESLITSSYTIEHGSLIIYNNVGQKIYSRPVDGEQKIPLPYDRFVQGQYFYKLIDFGNNFSLSGTFIR